MKPTFKADGAVEKKFHFDNVYWDDPHMYESIALYQIGDLCCERNYIGNAHEQVCYELSYIVSGKGWFSTNGCRYAVKEGDVYLSLPQELHNVESATVDPLRFYYVGFNFNQSIQNPFSNIQKMLHKVKTPLVSDKMEMQTPFHNIFNELIHSKSYSNLIINACLHQIVIYAYRNYFDYWENGYMPEKDTQNNQYIIYKIINYIDNHLCEISGLSHIAEHLDYSYSYLSHLFSKEAGLTMLDYYNKKKFEQAIVWLKEDNLSITEIAVKLGYQSIHPFTKAFKKVVGLSPIQYLALIKKKA